jgi:hypothetical protein
VRSAPAPLLRLLPRLLGGLELGRDLGLGLGIVGSILTERGHVPGQALGERARLLRGLGQRGEGRGQGDLGRQSVDQGRGNGAFEPPAQPFEPLADLAHAVRRGLPRVRQGTDGVQVHLVLVAAGHLDLLPYPIPATA